jgi:hypothetical protein
MSADRLWSGPYFHPVSLGQQSNLGADPSATAPEVKGARVGFFRIPFNRCDRRGHWIAAGRALKEKNMNERFGASAHGNLPRFESYRNAQNQPIPQDRNLGAGKALGKKHLSFVFLI